jgi:hypothetical protein
MNWERRMDRKSAPSLPLLSINWFKDNGCELTSPSLAMFSQVYMLSNGRPCVECNCKATCPAWPKVKMAKEQQ